ncbi:MAG: hypothetical protein KAT05_15675 [Spirochaetes bacterium]|nr:hypothetical protein [Spirochaetota bacterium]
MPASIPQWITDIESDETIVKKKSVRLRYIFSILFIVFIIVGFPLLVYSKLYFNLFGVAIMVMLVILLFIQFGIKNPYLPDLLAANLYRIGTELEAFNASSPSYIKRNQQYLKNCQRIINQLMMGRKYFIQNYLEFLNNLENTILRLNNLYLSNSKLKNESNISVDLKALATSIHENHKNLEPLHTAHVDGILSNLQDVEPMGLNLPLLNRLYNSFNTSWYNVSYSYRAIITLFVIGIIIFSASSIVMIYVLSMEKSESYGYAILGTLTFMGGLITQIDKIVPREKVKFS